MNKRLFILCSLIIGFRALSQEYSAKVVGENNEPLSFATVIVNSTETTITNENGTFNINTLKKNKENTITISLLGYTTFKGVLNPKVRIYRLKTNVSQLEDVLIQATTKVEKTKKSAFNVEALSVKKLKGISADVNQVLNFVPGIQIRQARGLGSDFSLSLNGLSGNRVRTFIDGVPMDYFGSSLTLNNFPINIIDNIAVYKGVVPIGLSADALGGAINIITNKSKKSYLDVSYSLGSYNTHRAAVNAQYFDKKTNFVARLKSFYNYSDNDYKIDVELPDFSTGKKTASQQRRFNDAYTSRMLWGEIGFLGKTFADELLIGALYSDNHKEIMEPEVVIGTSIKPAGEAFRKENKYIFNFSYLKKHLFVRNLKLRAYAVTVFSEERIQDISDYIYDWTGNKKLKTDLSTGELEGRKTKFTLDTRNHLANIQATYEFIPNHIVKMSSALNFLRLQGEDALHSQKSTQFAELSDLNKNIIAFGYNNILFDSKWENNIFFKKYFFNLKTIQTNYQGNQKTPFNSNKNYSGYGLASTYRFTKKLQVRLSYENTLRFPEVVELFGNGLLLVANPSLKSETSKNYNIGVFLNRLKFNKHYFSFSVNGFIRDTKDYIQIQPTGVLSHYENQQNVFTEGIDASLSYDYNKKFNFQINATYQNLFNNSKWVDNVIGGQRNPFYKAKIPNEPTLFGNGNINYIFSNLFRKEDQLQLSNSHNYVAEFLYLEENLAKVNKPNIPKQYTTDFTTTYISSSKKYNVSLAVNNIFDAKVFDNLNQQKLGRFMSVKLRYFIN